MTACSGQQKPASERSESREAKRLMQGVWLDDSESAVFQAKGDTVYYADSTSMPAYFRVVDDTLYIGKEGRYHIEKQTEHLLWFKSETGELTKLSKSDDEVLKEVFAQTKPQVLTLTQVLKRDTVVYYNGQRYHLYVAINPTKYKVSRHVLNEDGSLDSANVASFLPWEMIPNFGGTFDGQGHKISGLYADVKKGGMALFNKITLGKYDWEHDVTLPVAIKNLVIEDAFFASDKGNVAGFVLEVKGKTGASEASELVMENCHFKGTLHSRSQSAGGLVAYSSGTLSITDSHSEGLVHAYSNTGGLAAMAYGTTSISNSYNMAKVLGGYSETAGLLGIAQGVTSIMNSFNRGEVANDPASNNSGITAGLVGTTSKAFTLLLQRRNRRWQDFLCRRPCREHVRRRRLRGLDSEQLQYRQGL